MRLATFRFALVGAGLVCLYALAASWVGSWVARDPTPDNLRAAIRWDESNALLWRMYGRSKQLQVGQAELRDAAVSYEQALARNPQDIMAWEGLATIYSRLGNVQKEEAARRGGIAAMPHSPSAAWGLANFLVQQERNAEAFPYLRIAAAQDSALRIAAFDLGWKLLDDPELIFKEIVPDGIPSRTDYVHFLIQRRRFQDAYPVWKEIRAAGTPPVVALGLEYAGVLAANNLGTAAASVWKDTLELQGPHVGRRSSDRMTNGDFEAALYNGGLDWRLDKGSGFEMALDSFVMHTGTRSLRVAFDGTQNVAFRHVRQWVAVEPNQMYRFRAFIKTENISTDQGVYFAITPQGVSAEWRTPVRVGTLPWTQEQMEFATGPNTSVVLVELGRDPSAKLNNLLLGKVWIDNVTLEPLNR